MEIERLKRISKDLRTITDWVAFMGVVTLLTKVCFGMAIPWTDLAIWRNF